MAATFPVDFESKAREHILAALTLIVRPREGGGFQGFALQLPTVVASAATPPECLESLMEALVLVLSEMLREGRPLPDDGTRHAQVNTRITEAEKATLLQVAKARGLSMSELVRSLIVEYIAKNAPPQSGYEPDAVA